MTTKRELVESLKLTDVGKAFIDDVESVKDYLPKCNSMEFPKTFDEFANDYGFTDDKEIYTNGSHLIPVFRVKQWLDHIEQQPSDDCVSRQAVLETIDDCNSDGLKGIFCSYDDGERFKEHIKKLTPTTPTFPKGATNGDIIRTMFSNGKIDEGDIHEDNLWFNITGKGDYVNFGLDWWNAPYKGGSEDGSN